MNFISAPWRVPVLVRATLVGLLVAAAGSYPWAWLAAANLRHLRAVPWGAALMALYLWFYWRYFTGHGWPRRTAPLRRERSRVRALPASVWGAAILAGILGLAASLVLSRLVGRIVSMPTERAPDVSGTPPGTLLAFLIVGSLVAGIVEEIAFRGYMQRPIERTAGPVIAILAVGVVFGLAHGTHTEWSLVLMPYYLAVAATYGALAWLTDSILPSLALHAGGDLLSGMQLLTAGHSPALANGPAATVSPTGVNVRFWINLAILAALIAATVWAYRRLALVVRDEAAAHAAGAAVRAHSDGRQPR
jgi:membrane protease YdiL (CAAX protease family)